MPALTHDTPQHNQTAFAHAMMAAMSSYLDAAAIGNTEIGRAHLHLAKSFADDAVKATHDFSDNERVVAQTFIEALEKVRLV